MANAGTGNSVTPNEFIAKWRAVELKESSAAQEHFIDLCRLLGEPTPAEDDPTGERYCFERGARKDTGGGGWADVWKRHHFAWEYKGKHADLDAAFAQLRQYVLALENPPLLIVSDMTRFRIRTNWTNSVSETHEFTIYDLADAAPRDILKWALSDPERLRPGETRQELTERAAAAFADLAHGLRERGHDPQAVAHFVNRLVFCMFAEDMGLLPDRLFRRMLEQARRRPSTFADLAGRLFGTMAAGGLVGFEEVAWFNGGLFDDDTALPLDPEGISIVRKAAALDWSEIDPSILGVLFERGLDPDKRSQLGAHYTDRDKIMRIVEPVVTHPWLAEWRTSKDLIRAELDRAVTVPRFDTPALGLERTRRRDRAERLLRDFLERLRAFTVLDPACGSGNFLYLALQALKDLERRVQLEAEELGLSRRFPAIGPANVKGIEINPFAAELARVSVWIGEIQWMRRNGFSEVRDPILRPLDTIECRDAVLTPDGNEPDWPAADVVIGNPPFLGGKLLRGVLGGEYVEAIQRIYGDRIHGEADLVCHWFDKAQRLVAAGRIASAGLVATNSIRGGRNRSVLDRIVEQGAIFDAWSDKPWVVDGAAVRVSLICFAGKDAGLPMRLNGEDAPRINADLTSTVDLTHACRLPQNAGVAFMGDTKNGAFDIPGKLAREWLRLPANPSGRPNSDVLKPWVNGMDLTRRPAGKWIVDFGSEMIEADAALYEGPFAHVAKHVKPVRQPILAPSVRDHWWRHTRPRPGMWQALAVIPTSLGNKSPHGGEAIQRGVGPVVIVGGEPRGQGAESAGVGAIQAGVGPFVDQGLDEALGLAVGLGPIGARDQVAEAQLAARGLEGAGLGVGPGAIRHHGLDGHPALAEKGVGLGEEMRRGGTPLIGVGPDEGHAGAVVHSHVQKVIAAAPPAGRSGAPAEAMPTAWRDPGQLLDIEMDQFAGPRPLVAHRAPGRPVEIGQARNPMPAQHTVDGGARHPQEPGQAMRAPAPRPPRAQDPLLHLLRQGVGPAMGDGRAVGQSGDPVLAVPAQPAIGRLPRDLLSLGRRRHRPAAMHDPLDEDLAPIRVQAPSTMSHESLLSVGSSNSPHRVWRLSSVNQAHGKYS